MSVPFIVISSIYLRYTFGEVINLYGDAGEAYAIEVNIGHPHQKFKLLVDTGSTTLALASYAREDSNVYFHADNSSSLYNSGTTIEAAYTQGTWTGLLASDFIQFPSLNIPEVRSDFALITKSHEFFTKASVWQGLLGLAYNPVGAWGKSGAVESWLDALDRNMNKPMSFQLKLCGPISTSNTTHYGYFEVIDNQTPKTNHNKTFRTPVLRKRWYEVGVIGVRVLSSLTSEAKNKTTDEIREPDKDMCVQLNTVKSIVDSGTTQIKLPDKLFREVVDELKNEFRKSQVLILDEFWNRREAACWLEPQVWTLPWLAIDLLSADADNQYFTLEIPPQNYMLVVGVHNSSDTSGTVSTYCYKLGLETGYTETVLGYTAMEGLQVTFNRSAGWIGFQTSDCGANARITGPYNTSNSLKTTCELIKPVAEVATSIQAAQWALCAISIIAASVLLYLLAPCLKNLFLKKMPRSQQISLSQAALVEEDSP
ncbi:beta-secretase 1-like [Spodoptera frugiperda]|uniref:Beta-secretase 1-like n=1 Tax=Spodoptera frugiperda TaxID=7108 RepID=A0A9R0DET9_SPOFR|nr:beta-secretase 1-like [Spodoptera frugiperda]